MTNREVTGRISASASLGDLRHPPRVNLSASWHSLETSTSYLSLRLPPAAADVTPSAPARTTNSSSASFPSTSTVYESVQPSTVYESVYSCPSFAVSRAAHVEAFEEVPLDVVGDQNVAGVSDAGSHHIQLDVGSNAYVNLAASTDPLQPDRANDGTDQLAVTDPVVQANSGANVFHAALPDRGNAAKLPDGDTSTSTEDPGWDFFLDRKTDVVGETGNVEAKVFTPVQLDRGNVSNVQPNPDHVTDPDPETVTALKLNPVQPDSNDVGTEEGPTDNVGVVESNSDNVEALELQPTNVEADRQALQAEAVQGAAVVEGEDLQRNAVQSEPENLLSLDGQQDGLHPDAPTVPPPNVRDAASPQPGSVTNDPATPPHLLAQPGPSQAGLLAQPAPSAQPGSSAQPQPGPSAQARASTQPRRLAQPQPGPSAQARASASSGPTAQPGVSGQSGASAQPQAGSSNTNSAQDPDDSAEDAVPSAPKRSRKQKAAKKCRKRKSPYVESEEDISSTDEEREFPTRFSPRNKRGYRF